MAEPTRTDGPQQTKPSLWQRRKPLWGALMLLVCCATLAYTHWPL